MSPESKRQESLRFAMESVTGDPKTRTINISGYRIIVLSQALINAEKVLDKLRAFKKDVVTNGCSDMVSDVFAALIEYDEE